MPPGPSAITSSTREAAHGESSAGAAAPFVPASASWWHIPHVGMKIALPRASKGVRWTCFRGAREPPPQPARTRTAIAAARLAVRTFEDDEHGQLLVRREVVLDSGLDEDRLADVDRDALVSDLEDAGALEPDVDLVVGVGLLAVRVGSDEDVDAELQPFRLVDDLVAAACVSQTLDGAVDPEGM